MCVFSDGEKTTLACKWQKVAVSYSFGCSRSFVKIPISVSAQKEAERTHQEVLAHFHLRRCNNPQNMNKKPCKQKPSSFSGIRTLVMRTVVRKVHLFQTNEVTDFIWTVRILNWLKKIRRNSKMGKPRLGLMWLKKMTVTHSSRNERASTIAAKKSIINLEPSQ